MNSKLIKNLVAVWTMGLTIYLFGAFVSLETNPANWHIGGRICSAAVLIMCIVVYAVIEALTAD